jgi:hypothetical protein
LDIRALQKTSATDRVASCWYATRSFTLDLAFNDGNAHQVALYLVDFDRQNRAATVEVLDADNAVLDKRSVSGFTGGQYLVWNLNGKVRIRITRSSGVNAVASGIFFDNLSALRTTRATASFVGLDTATGGSWKGVYGADGFNVFTHAVSYPSYVTVTPSGSSAWQWSASTSDLRALQKSSAGSNRVASCWYATGSFTMDLTFNDGNAHRIALYVVDFDRQNRAAAVEVLDVNDAVLDTRSISDFTGGQYLVWNLSGQVRIRISRSSGVNAVASGLFFR